jgi:hydroxymethylpyrimidine/phosphomethylpyrimidine kinase
MKLKHGEVMPVALSIAGSDSGGGAGIQADLRTFAAFGVHGLTALTCVTAQNPQGVLGVQAMRTSLVRAQIEAVWGPFRPGAVKTGMLYSASIIREVVEAMEGVGRGVPLVVDPVMIATSGANLLQSAAFRILRDRLLPRATLATPNLDELSLLTGRPIRSVEQLRGAARELRERCGCAVLAKGGHLKGSEAVDILWDGREEWMLTATRVVGVSTHGTGCTYSAAIAAGLARGWGLVEAVREAKDYITQAIGDSRRAGGCWVLGHSRNAWKSSGKGLRKAVQSP